MTKIKVEHSTDYTVLSNSIFRDKNLSLKARGLLTTMLSMPDDWDFTTQGLIRILKDGDSSIRSAIKELELAHYLERVRTRNEKGTFAGIEYVLHETPYVANPSVEEPHVENQHVDNQRQLNKYILNKQELNKQELNNYLLCDHNEKTSDFQTKFIPPTVEQVKAYCHERKNNISPEIFCDYYASKGWMIGRNKMKDWKAAVRTWENKDKQKPKVGDTGVELDDEIDHSLDGIF